MKIDELENLKRNCIVIDIETSSSDNEGNPIDIRTDFEQYVERANCNWIKRHENKEWGGAPRKS